MVALHHIALRTRDVDGLVAFYVAWFEFAIVRDARPRSVWLRFDQGAVLMIERAGADEPAPDARSLELLALRVDVQSRQALRARLIAEGRLEGETEHSLYFRDPDGRRVGVSSYPL